jgi:hypothetical protein
MKVREYLNNWGLAFALVRVHVVLVTYGSPSETLTRFGHPESTCSFVPLG